MSFKQYLKNPFISFTAGVVLTAGILYFSSIKPSIDENKSYEQKISTMEIDSLQSANTIDSLMENYEYKIDSLSKRLDITERDLGYAFLSMDYFLNFESMWIDAICAEDFSRAKSYEDKGFYSLDLLEEIRTFYDIDNDVELNKGFIEQIVLRDKLHENE